MKILHVLAQLPSKTGSGVYFSNIIKGLDPNHEQACIYGYQGEYEFDLIPEANQYAVEFGTDRLPFDIVGMSDVMPYASTKYCDMTDEMQEQWSKEFSITLHEAIVGFDPDVIISHHLWMLTSLVRDKYLHGKIIGISHGTDIRQCEKNPELKEKYLKNIKRLDKIFALSELQVPEIMETYGVSIEKIAVMGGGFDEHIFYPALASKCPSNVKIVYAGKFSRAKGVFELLKVFRRLNSTYPDVELIMLGAQDELHREEFMVNVQGIENIKVMTVVPQTELADIFRSGDIFILPSFYEGLGLVAIEALACGMRAVTTEIEGLISMLGHRINKSGVIEYVELPRLFDADRAYEEDLEGFRDRLEHALSLQIERVKNKEKFPEEIAHEIRNHSWKNIVGRIENEIRFKE